MWGSVLWQRTDANSALLTLELVSTPAARFGDRSFSAAGPHVPNGLPSALRT